MTNDFRRVLEALGETAGVETGRMFGSDALKVGGKVFSICVKDRLVVKLPEQRAKELIQRKLAAPFDPGHGRIMKEWVAIAPDTPLDWTAISKESKAFVARSR